VKIQDVMTRNPRCVTPETTVREAARIMKDEDIGIVPVTEGDNRRLVGVVTDRDIAVRVVADGRDADTRVGDVMSAGKIATRRQDEDIDTAMDTMAKEQVRRIPVVDERGSLVGIVAQADIVLKVRNDKKAEHTIEKISEPGNASA
jgi:CBS domain-containing protein